MSSPETIEEFVRWFLSQAGDNAAKGEIRRRAEAVGLTDAEVFQLAVQNFLVRTPAPRYIGGRTL